MKYDQPVKTWNEWAHITSFEIEALSKCNDELKKAITDEVGKREALQEQFIDLRARMYTIAIVVIIIVGIIEVSIRVF